MMGRISWAAIVPFVALALSPAGPPHAASTDERMKDEWPVVFFGEALEQPIPVVDAEKANLVEIGFVRSWKEKLEPTAERLWFFPPEDDRAAMVQLETGTLQTVHPLMMTWARERGLFPVPSSQIAGAGCDAPLPQEPAQGT